MMLEWRYRSNCGGWLKSLIKALPWWQPFKLGVGNVAKISCHVFFWLQFHDFIKILCHFGFTILSEQYSQTNFPIIKTKPFKVAKYKKEWWIIRPKWVKIKVVVIILYLLLKNKNKDTHYKYTYYTNKTNSALFSGTTGIFSRNIKEIEWTNIKIKHYIDWFLLKQLYFVSVKTREFFSLFVFCCFNIKNTKSVICL